MTTGSDKRLKTAMRSFISKDLERGTSYIGSSLPLDKQVNSAMLGVVDVFFPLDLQIRFHFRDTLVDDGRPSKFGYAYLVVDTPLKTEEMQNWMDNIPGTVTTDKKTGKQCIVPDNDYLCAVEAIKGDPDIDDVSFLCLGFLLMRGEEFEAREVEPYVTGSDIFDSFNVTQNGGSITLGNGFHIAWGNVSIVLDGTNPSSVSVTFPHEFAVAPKVLVTPVAQAQFTSNLNISVNASTVTGVTINAYDTTAYTAYVTWLAIGKRSGY